MAASIMRVENPSCEQFVADLLPMNAPLLITDAIGTDKDGAFWTPQSLSERFGHCSVPIYNDYFDLTSVGTLNRYLNRYFGRTGAISKPVPYVRWYSRLRDIDFAWSDELFEAVRPHWRTPRCAPVTDLVLPLAPSPQIRNPNEHGFPGRGLFVSGRGARTGLHRDPWASDAFLCQLYGTKKWRLFAPEQAPLLTSGTKTADLDHVAEQWFPHAGQTSADFEFNQQAGEVVYIPHGWFHAVDTVADSISITWNFVHRSKQAAFRSWLEFEACGVDLLIAQYFLAAPQRYRVLET